MKKTILIFIAITTVIHFASAQDQIQKGKFYVGGDINYNYDQAGSTTITQYTSPPGTTYYTNYHITSFDITPNVGFFVADKFSVGILLGYSHLGGTEINNYVAGDNTSTSYVRTDTYHTNAVSFGLNFRYYWMLTDRIGVFPQVGVYTSNNTTDFNEGALTLGANPNIVFFATKKLAINMGFGNLSYVRDYSSKTYDVNFGLNSNIGFGLNYYW